MKLKGVGMSEERACGARCHEEEAELEKATKTFQVCIFYRSLAPLKQMLTERSYLKRSETVLMQVGTIRPLFGDLVFLPT